MNKLPEIWEFALFIWGKLKVVKIIIFHMVEYRSKYITWNLHSYFVDLDLGSTLTYIIWAKLLKVVRKHVWWLGFSDLLLEKLVEML